MKFPLAPWSDPEHRPQDYRDRVVEVVQDGRIYIELINGSFLFSEKGPPEEFRAGLDLAIERGWLTLHES